jgi:peptide/nickel transport system substrate-binding protein
MRQRVSFFAAVTVVAAICVSCGTPPTQKPQISIGTPRGGDLVVSVRAEPQSFNPLTRRDSTTQLIALLTQARLFRVNPATQALEPWLVDQWTRAENGTDYTLTLKSDLAFADGTPVTSADVVFSLAAAYDKGSIYADSLQVGGKRLTVRAVDARTVVLSFPSAFSPGLRLLDVLPILPRHRLEPALKTGEFGSAWGVATPVDAITGLGPFMLAEYAAGERLTFQRNPHFFRKDDAGVPLPYLDRVIVEILTGQDAQLLKLQSGQSDGSAFEIRAEDYAQLKGAADASAVQILDVGTAIDPDSLWINLAPGAFAGDPRRDWIQREELRHAISLAVDRSVFVDTVYLGAATPVFGPISPANRAWYSGELPYASHDPAKATALLASLGFADRNRDGLLDDVRGQPVRFTILTAKGQTTLERGAFVIANELKKIGVSIDVVALEPNALIHKLVSGKGYDAIYFHLSSTDTDPAMQPEFWMSNGDAHVWNLHQNAATTDWERAIDELMIRQAASFDDAERKQLFLEVQKIFAAHEPVIYFAAPRIMVAASKRMQNLHPAVARPQLLWSIDTIAVAH